MAAMNYGRYYENTSNGTLKAVEDDPKKKKKKTPREEALERRLGMGGPAQKKRKRFSY